MPVVKEAGAVVARREDDKLLILLVTAKGRPNEWIFPKGHIERGESAEAAALREAQEEAGVRGHIVAPLGELQFVSNADVIQVSYFLVRYERTTGNGDGRCVQWYSFDDSGQRLAFPDARELLERHKDLIERSIRPADEPL